MEVFFLGGKWFSTGEGMMGSERRGEERRMVVVIMVDVSMRLGACGTVGEGAR